MMKFTFRKHKAETGLAAVGYSRRSVDIKHKKMVVGTIYAPNWSTKDGKWGLSIMVEDSDCKCGWKWVHLKHRCDTEEEAREFLKENLESILEQNNLTLHHTEPFNDY